MPRELKRVQYNCGENHVTVVGTVGVSMSAREAVRNPGGGGFIESRAKVGIASGGLDLTVAEKLSDHRPAFTERESPVSE